MIPNKIIFKETKRYSYYKKTYVHWSVYRFVGKRFAFLNNDIFLLKRWSLHIRFFSNIYAICFDKNLNLKNSNKKHYLRYNRSHSNHYHIRCDNGHLNGDIALCWGSSHMIGCSSDQISLHRILHLKLMNNINKRKKRFKFSFNIYI